MSDDRSSEGQQSPGPVVAAPLKVFVNYRREDAAGTAIALFDQLAKRFGSENVFLDVKTLQPGMKWLEEIKAHGVSCGVFIALIGPHWMSILKDRQHASYVDPAEDFVRREIEIALSRQSSVQVIPVLVDDAAPPDANKDKLPPSLRALGDIHAEQLRHAQFDQDVERLMGRLERIALEGVARQAAGDAPAPDVVADGATEAGTPPSLDQRPAATVKPGRVAPKPDEAHYDTVLRHMVDQGTVVPLLGSGVNGGGRDKPWEEGCGAPPDAGELAADLARRFGMQSEPVDLAEVAQYVYVTLGRPDLYRTLKQILAVECEPSAVHRFLARFPGRLEELGLPARHQLIVNTNYDTALERAFDQESEPYDLAVYMASGEDKGRFVHFPWESEPKPVAEPNSYGSFPIDDYGELERTVIIKIHGAVDGGSGGYRWKENYVITEDHYIDYLSTRPVESLVPVQILDKLRASHCLFLGYTMRDWNLRVFLKRIWKGERLDARSWALEQDPNVLEKEFWSGYGVDLFEAPLADYLNELSDYLVNQRTVDAKP
jgi:hypothetical protein